MEMQLISGKGKLNKAGLDKFINSEKLQECGISYAVVAIMGPQSSGKSTLLNKLFRTNFTEMKASDGRTQTTKGVWMAKARDMKPFTMVLDLEGSDGEQRGEDDTLFERQSALFALAVSQVVIINMWCHDVGRVNGANTPLLRTIFEVVIRLFSPRKRTLFFVLRDKTKTPIDKLGKQLRGQVEKIWETVPKPQAFRHTNFHEIFNMNIHALPDYEYMEDEFNKEVVELKKKISILISPKDVANDGKEIVPASGFSSSVKKIWETIEENKDLDIPALKVLIATQKCEVIANEKLRLFASDQYWLALREAADTGLVSDFGAIISKILSTYLSEYDSESEYFEEDVKARKRQYLKSEAMKLVRPAHLKTLRYLRAKAFQSYKTQFEEEILNSEGGLAESVGKCRQSCVLQFDQRCAVAAIDGEKSDVSTVRNELLNDIKTHTLPRVESQIREQLCAEVSAELDKLLIFTDTSKDIEWASIRDLLYRKRNSAASALSSAVGVYQLDKTTLEQMDHDLKQHCRKLVKKKLKELADEIQKLMRERFVIALVPEELTDPAALAAEEITDPASEDELVEEKDKIQAIYKAYGKCVKLLSSIAVMRLDEKKDDVEIVLDYALIAADGVVLSEDPLDSPTWREVPSESTLLKPGECKHIWKDFKDEIEPKVNAAISLKEKSEELKNHYPFWLRVGLLVFGNTQFMKLLTNVHRMDLLKTVISKLASQGNEIFKKATKWLEAPRKYMKKIKEALLQFFMKFFEKAKRILGNTAQAKYILGNGDETENDWSSVPA